MVKKHLFVFATLLTSLVFAESNWTGGVRPGGNGFYLAAPDQGFNLNFLGYGQFVGTIMDHNYRLARNDGPFGFNLRRARLTTLATVQRDAELMIEVGTPTIRSFPVAGAPSVPDIGLVEARVSLNVFDEWLQVRLGKFTGPFSRENARSARSQDFIERSNILSSMLLAPTLDTQIGLMLFGRAANGILNYYFGIFNGNSDSVSSVSDTDGAKEVQAKLEIHPHPNFMIGFGYDTDQSPTRTLSLVDHSLTPMLSSTLEGRRHGFEIDWDWTISFFNWKTELLFFTFPDHTGQANFARMLAGGYTQLGFQVAGDTTSGLQILLRYEYANLLTTVTNVLHSGILGFNLFINPNLTFTVNYVAEYGANNATGAYANSGFHHLWMNQLQVKF